MYARCCVICVKVNAFNKTVTKAPVDDQAVFTRDSGRDSASERNVYGRSSARKGGLNAIVSCCSCP